MFLPDQAKKNIQSLMQDPRWLSVEGALERYLLENFVQSSIKRENEFETIFWLAHSEGGKDHLQRFMSSLENAAKQV
jgi:hypothetical protein